MRHPKLVYGFMAALGIVLLSILFATMADATFYDYAWGLFSSMQGLLTSFLWFCLLGGAFFSIVGIVGIGRHYLRNRSNSLDVDSFTVIAVNLILLVVFGLYFYFVFMAALTIGF